jgi:hypothetical protein
MVDATRAAVAAWASYVCEYCRLHEADDGFSFHVEHIVARKHGGTDDLDNLAFACQFWKVQSYCPRWDVVWMLARNGVFRA